jgi:hypothetical protein
MFEAEECVYRYRKLLQLLEEDTQEISACLQGELLEEYRGLLTREKDILNDALRTMQYQL